MEIDINSLAPWVAIAVTLILSILVPLFTQIANNRFQLKKARQDRKLNEEKEKLCKKIEAYEHFLMNVGAVLESRGRENLTNAGASIGRIYLYVPSEWYQKLDALHYSLYNSSWSTAEDQYLELAQLVSEEYRNVNTEPVKKNKK